MPGVSIDEAVRLTGLSTTTIRRRIRSGEWVAEMVGGRWMIDPEQLGRRFPEVETGEESRLNLPGDQIKQAQPPVSSVPDDAMLVPLSAWQSMMDQLGNLHEAGQQLAEARERAGRAEEREAFQLERHQIERERREAAERENAELREQIAGVAPEPKPDRHHIADDVVAQMTAEGEELRAHRPPAKEPAPEPEPAIEPTPAAEHLPHLDDAVVERLAHLDEHRAYQPPKSWWQRIRFQNPRRR